MSLYYQGHAMTKYFAGDCGDFAVGVHRQVGGKLAALIEHDEELQGDVLIHAFVQCDDGTILDASGDESDIETMLSEFPHCGSARLVNLTEPELFEIAYGVTERVLTADVLRDVAMLLSTVGRRANAQMEPAPERNRPRVKP
jgi:hypothetical protein